MNIYLKDLERIEFSITMCCTGRCRHCSQGEHEGFSGHIDGAIAAELVEKVCRSYAVKSLMTFGGEPLLYPETVCTSKKSSILAKTYKYLRPGWTVLRHVTGFWKSLPQRKSSMASTRALVPWRNGASTIST